jgi:thioredoxin reductase (NADPH)
MSSTHYDVAVVGGGAAGLSAAVALARSLRSVVVIDACEPRNAPAAHAHNLLGREGVPPLDLLAAGRGEAESYGAEIRPGRTVAVRRVDDGFELDLADGARLTARRLLLATGLVDELPDVPGVRERWGRDVLHCPYCHGWEVRGQRIGVLATGPLAGHQALLFRQLSDDVTVLLHTAPELEEEVAEQLAALGVEVVRGAVERLTVEGDRLTAVVLADGRDLPVDAVAVGPRFVARSDLWAQLGGTLTDHPMGAFIESDPMGRTAVPGVWTAGNAGNLSAMVGMSAAEGVMAGAAINADLVTEDARAAIERARVAVG